MFFYPRNKYLQVQVKDEKIEQQNPLSGFMMPDNAKNVGGSLKFVKLVNTSPDSSYEKDIGSFLLVSSHLIETLDVEGQALSLIPEHAVYGVMVKV